MKAITASVFLLICVAASTLAQAQTLDQLAARGAVVAGADPLSVELRNRAPDDSVRRGFDIGMAAAEGQTLPGPGKQRIHDSLPPPERSGFDTAVSFSLQRNQNAQLAATGAAIARADAAVAQARTADRDVFYWLGFDIASGIFGDPARGAAGNTLMGPGSERIRNALNPAAQRGFNASVALHTSRNYRNLAQVVPIPSSNARVADPHVFVTKPNIDAQVIAIPADKPRDRQCSELFQFTRGKAPSIAAVWEPVNEELHVFAIDARGTLKDVWKHDYRYWEPSLSLSAPGLAPAGAPLAAVWQPLNRQLEVFTIAPNGALEDVWKANGSRWFAPIYISPPSFAPPGAHLAAISQPLNNTLEVFAVDATGTVRVVWKAQNGDWQQPHALTPPGSAPPGAPLAVVWQPLNEQLEVFWIDGTGAVREVLKQHNGSWQPPSPVAAAGFANPGAGIAAVWQPLNEQLEVFAADRCGAIKDVWKAHNTAWQQPVVIYGAGDAPAGAALVALWSPQFEELRVIAVGLKGQVMNAYKRSNRRWEPGAKPDGGWARDLTHEATAPPGAPLAGLPTTGNRFEVFTLDTNQAVRNLSAGVPGLAGWVGATITRSNYGPIYGTHAAACTRYFRAWSYGDELHNDQVDECQDYMGITSHCDQMDHAIVTVGYPPQATTPRFLQCSPRAAPDDVIEQLVHITKGVGEGLVTAAPFVALVVQGYACLDGVVFACGTIAVDVGERLELIPDEVKQAYSLVNAAEQCSNGDVIACAKLGAAGAKAAGVNIPGEDVGQIALMSQQCVNEDFGACLRLGEKAADAAGVHIGALNQVAKAAQDCYGGNTNACIALGEQAADARVPVRNLIDGAGKVDRCSGNQGINQRSVTDCLALGQDLASMAR